MIIKILYVLHYSVIKTNNNIGLKIYLKYFACKLNFNQVINECFNKAYNLLENIQ